MDRGEREVSRGTRLGTGGIVNSPRSRLLVWVLAAASLWGTATVRAQAVRRPGATVYPDFSNAADQLLRAAAGQAQAKQWNEAVDLYLRAIQQYGDTVTPVPADDANAPLGGETKLYVDVRSYVQRRLAALPPEARAVYRARVDATAERWYRDGLTNRDRALLRRVVEEAFCSGWGDEALEALGDIAFQDGRPQEALAAYERLSAGPEAIRAGLPHPDPSVDRARLQVKTWLVRAALGAPTPTPAELDAFRKEYPDAQGTVAGRTGNWVDVLLRALNEDRIAFPEPLDLRWPTLGGSMSRNRVLAEEVDVGSPQWTVRLERVNSSRGSASFGNRFSNPAPTAVEPITAYHPIVLGNQVVVADENAVRAYDLDERPKNADDVVWQHPPQGPLQTVPQARVPTRSARFSLSAAGDRIFARLGPTGSANGQSNSAIVALQRSREGTLLWKTKAGEVELPRRGNNAAGRSSIGFEGTPVADSRNVYVAISESGPRISTWVVCLNAESGKTRWARFVCEAPPGVDNAMGQGGMLNMGVAVPPPPDAGQRMLTLQGGLVFYQTNLGALACLDGESGQVRWVATYPRVDRPASLSIDRDLSPAIAHDGLVFIAPNDSAVVCAFEMGTGRLVWKRDDMPKAEHLLGVAHGRLIVTGDHVWMINTRDGKVLSTWPDNLNGLDSAGRGLITAEHIYWPTRGEVQVLDITTGMRATNRPPIQLSQKFQQNGGNLVAGDGYLVVAGAESLVVFSQNSRLIQRYQLEIAKAPERALPYFHLAQVAEASGEDKLALANLEGALNHARPGDLVDGRPLAEVARARRFDLLLKLASRSVKAGDWETALVHYEAAAAAAGPGRDRLTAKLGLARAHQTLGRSAQAVATLQGLLDDDSVRTLTVPIDDRQTVRADIRITDLLNTIVKQSGRAAYAAYDARARELLRQAELEQNPRALEEIDRTYPIAACLPEALLRLGRVRLEEGRAVDAARAFKRLLAEADDDAGRATAWLELGRSHEKRHLWSAARDAYTQAAERYGNVLVPALGPNLTAAQVASQRLARPVFEKLGPASAEPGPTLPMARRWAKALDGPHRVLVADGPPPSPEVGPIFLARGGWLRSVNPVSGDAAWTIELPAEPVWLGYLADRLLVATEKNVIALGLERGEVLWGYEQPRDPKLKELDPFARDQGPISKSDPADGLSGFRVLGDRLVFRQGPRELVVLDGENGLVAWSFAAPTGTINPNILVGPQRIVLQVRKPHAVVVLDTADGRRLGEFEQPEKEPATWPRPPLPLDDDRVVLVLDERTVALFDLQRGEEAWRWVESSPLPRVTMPALFGDAGRLFALFDGRLLVRLDAKTGGKVWGKTLGSEDLSERPDAFGLDERRVYYASDLTVGAFELADGTPAWSSSVGEPASGWSLVLGRNCLMAYPRKSGDHEVREMLPLAVLDRERGSLIQRFLIASPVRELAVRFTGPGALVATQAGLWSLGTFPKGPEGPRPR